MLAAAIVTSTATLAYTSDPFVLLGVSLLAAVGLALGLDWLRRSRRHRSEPEISPPHRDGQGGDEITQPLPMMIRPQGGTSAIGSLRAAARSDKGMVRTVNEDDTLLAELADENDRVRAGVFAVADGLGGHDSGEIASSTAIEATVRALQTHLFFADGTYRRDDLRDEDVLDVLRDAVMAANRAVYAVKVDQGLDLATTLVLAFVVNRKAYLANVGDSRAYLVREGHIRQLTEDHSLVERMVASGQITEAEARLHPQRNLIFRSLGTEPLVEVDLFVERLQPGDRLVLCSDGLTTMVPDTTLAHIVAKEPDLDMACRLLIHAANDAGGKDNISTVLVELLPAEDGAQQ